MQIAYYVIPSAYQSPNYDTRQRSHNEREYKNRPTLEYSIHNRLSCVGRVFLSHDKNYARCFHHGHVRIILERRVFHFTIHWKTDDRAIFSNVILDNFGVVKWKLLVGDVCMAVATLLDNLIQNDFKDALDVAIFIFVNIRGNTPPLCF